MIAIRRDEHDVDVCLHLEDKVLVLMEALSRMRHENSDASVVPSARTFIIIWSTLVCSRCGEQDGTQRAHRGGMASCRLMATVCGLVTASRP